MEHYDWCDEKGEMKIGYQAIGSRYSHESLFLNNDFAYVQIDRQHNLIDRQGKVTPVSSLSLETPFINGISFVRGRFGVVLVNTSLQKANNDVYAEFEFNSSKAVELFYNIHTDYAIMR
ncbi:hypothetical protein H8784_08085 [Parabacteroides acidifaciens]|uniref:Uncharacterized protein n=1 Tax=Parabacteroides acidifaciens TaxID=2290935 RepID=A0A3D8HFF0_9BACT|nr:hypothetical protein [Parabacteroides acidifaciens]MBC8601680.1 hypothetical protein [Parabacteroides acidifaciens]RDU49666.1 hypothetical protein DWU89_08275 [Parabacteroides acidifaciens]